VSSTSATVAGNYAVTINTLATKGTLAGDPGTPTSLTIDGTNDTINVSLDGQTSTLTLTPGTYSSLDALAAEVQSKINGASTFSDAGSSVTVSTTGGVLTFTSNRYGSASNVNITGGNGQANLVGTGIATAGVDVAGTINGVAATGSGQSLIGATGDASEGLKLKVTGGATGPRGTVDFSKGIAYQLDQLMSSILDDDNGAIASATNGLNDTIKRLEDQQQSIQDHLAVVEQQYRAQFTALDTLMGNLNTTSTFLTQQLAKLS
jgi:flagellar hook-associated protein 2